MNKSHRMDIPALESSDEEQSMPSLHKELSLPPPTVDNEKQSSMLMDSISLINDDT